MKRKHFSVSFFSILVCLSLLLNLGFAFSEGADDSEGKSKLESRVEEVRKKREAEEQAEREKRHPVPLGKNVDAKKLIEIKSKGKLEWSSSDESVATVSPKGLIKGVSAGEAVISVKSVDSSEVNESINITVVVPVKKITLSEKSFEMPVDMTRQLTATIAPEEASIKQVEWSSSNEKIATVSEDGVITSHAIGKAKITATATDGSNAKASINLKVDQFDVVFDGMGSATQTLQTTGYGGLNIRVKTKNNLVDVEMTGYGTSLTPTGMYYTTDFKFTPKKSGIDVVTFSYGSSRISTRVFISTKVDEFKQELRSIFDEQEKKKDIVGEENAGNGSVLFKGIPWGSSYFKVVNALKDKGDSVKQAVVRSGTIWTQIEGNIRVGEYEAYDNGLSFACESVDKDTIAENMDTCEFFKVDCYFDLETPFDGLKQSLMEAYGPPENDTTGSDSQCHWEVNGVNVDLSVEKKFIKLTLECDQPEYSSL